AEGSITKATSQLLSVEVKDTVSGIDKDSIRFVFSTVMATLTPSSTRITPSAFTDITDGFRATFALGLGAGISWIGAEVTDNAGNTAAFDQDADNSGDQGNKLTIDTTAPIIAESYTGASYDAVTDALEFDKRNKILVTFTDAINLDGGTISSTDFDVEGSAVTDATFFDVTFSSSSVAKLGGEVVMRRAVVLTLAADLAPDKKPKISIVGDGVSDEAGNALTIGGTGASKNAIDKIAPKLTISSDLSSTLAGKDDKVQIDITSDEDLAASPVVQLFNMTSTSTVKTVTATSVGTNSWRVTTDKNTALTTAINVHVQGSDDSGNKAEVGLKGNADETADGAITYEADIALPAPTMTPLDKATPTERAPFFIVIDFAAEGSEYREDSHDTVTLTKVEVDGIDMLADAATIDNKKFLVAISDGLAIGEHTVKVNGKDEAGNVLASDLSVTFEVKERKPLKVALSPGWNLVSLPGNPADPSIDAVMANTPDATAVVTFNPTVPGGFLAAVRGPDGTFAGTLKTMDATRGYWVLTDTFAPIEVDVPPLAAGSAGVLPPTIPIKAGWNLVPVLDVTGTLSIGDSILATTYFATALGTGEITRVYWFDTVANAWILVNVSTGSVKVGAAYWVYTGKDANIVP
ncbi:MAG: hypothetical protein IIA44_09625, partial [Acidobacteria bacterium]|nr:hypothetical protein [Acidobacteriota bacterium]